MIDGKASILNLTQKGHRLAFQVQAAQPSLIQVHIFQFPGWKAFLDGQPVEPSELDMNGCMCFAIPQGDHEVALRFGHTPLRTASELVSLAALGLGLLLLLRGFLKSR